MQLVLYEVSMSAITVGSRGGDLSTYTILTMVVLAFTVPLNFPFY
nr:MAG TPA: hypothetical protein [Caudoviricetes sp.]